jgi:hypothetical protein
MNRRVLVAYANTDQTVEKLRRQQAPLTKFGRFAFNETDLLTIVTEAARICASLDVPFCKVRRYRAAENDLLIEAGCGWDLGVVGRVVSQADETSPQGVGFDRRLQGCCIATSHTFITICQASDGQR